VAQPIQAVQIYFEHPFGAEREVLREFFSFAGCLVKTTMMPVETMLEKHKSLVDLESKRIAHLFLTDRSPEGIALSKNEMWCSFRILKQELTINKKAILHNADQKISAEQFKKAALDVIIRRIWKNDEAETQSLLCINAAFWQLDMFEFLQIKSTFQALKIGELMALPMRGHYYLPEAIYLNKMADAFINMARQCSMGPSSIYAVYAYVNAQRHLRELLTSLEAHAPLRTKLYVAVEPVQKLLSELNKIYRIETNFVSMYCLAAALCEGQAQFALDARPYLRDAIEHAPEELKSFTAGIYLRYGVSEKQMHPDNERALQCFKKALQLNENYYPAIFQIACLCAIDKKYTEAKIGFRKATLLIQGNYNHRDWRDFSLEEVLYVFRCYIWLAKLALIEGGESSIGISIALAKNTAIAFVKMPILEKCCSIEHYGEAKNYHQGSITARAVLTVLRDMAGDSEVNKELQEEIDDIIRISKNVSDAV
jgi:tetratricopeptide (TPR) repeat protein